MKWQISNRTPGRLHDSRTTDIKINVNAMAFYRYLSLPQLLPEKIGTLDCDISFQELTDAVKQISLGCSPGIEGLSAEF